MTTTNLYKKKQVIIIINIDGKKNLKMHKLLLSGQKKT